MTTHDTESLNQLLANLHAERVATWRPEVLRVNIEQRQLLVDTENPDEYIKVGAVIDSCSVPSVDGGVIELEPLLARGPGRSRRCSSSALIGWCALCRCRRIGW